MNYQGIAWEEIVECLGVGNDIVHDAFSLFSDYWFPAKNLDHYGGTLTPYEDDLDVLRMCYLHDLGSNLEPWECANIVYAPNGCFYQEHGHDKEGFEIGFSLSKLNPGDRYEFKAISLDENNSSYFSDPIRVIIESGRPKDWEWSAPIMTGELEVYMSSVHNCPAVSPVTADEWNEFTDRINEFLVYVDGGKHTFIDVEPEEEFTPVIYNRAAEAIRDIGYVDIYDLPNISFDTELTPDLFDALSDALNSTP